MREKNLQHLTPDKLANLNKEQVNKVYNAMREQSQSKTKHKGQYTEWMEKTTLSDILGKDYN